MKKNIKKTTVSLYSSPLSLGNGKGKFILNLNQYRNAHFRKKNKAKHDYKEFMIEQISKRKGRINKALFIYTIYAKDMRRFDVGNVVSIHQKFFEDAIVELGKLEDDKYSVIPMFIGCYGGIDKDNPRVEIEVVEIGEDWDRALPDIVGKIIKEVYGE